MSWMTRPFVAVVTDAGGGSYAFVDVNVIPMDAERVLERQTVVVESGTIVALGSSASTSIPQAVACRRRTVQTMRRT